MRDSRGIRLFYSLCSLLILFLPGQGATTVAGTSGRGSQIASKTSHARDDLEWLVGRWRCVEREYLTQVENLLGSHAEDSLAYINVYFPYADDRVTLDLTGKPDDRQIAAEFLVRHITETPEFQEQLAPMLPRGPVGISTNLIRVGWYPFECMDFKYQLTTKGGRFWLTLESKHMRLRLYKLNSKVGDIRTSFVTAPIRDYPEKRLSEITSRYNSLRNPNGDRGN